MLERPVAYKIRDLHDEIRGGARLLRFTAELRRLLGYVRPYAGRLVLAIGLMGVVGLAEGLTALMFRPIFDFLLEPSQSAEHLPLFKLPFSDQTLYLNSFFPESVQHVWAVIAISILVIFLAKAVAEFFGNTMIQYVGHAAVTDLRNEVYRKLLRQPIGFFQHNPTGKLMSAAISDVERVRSALSEWLADFFRQSFTLLFMLLVLLRLDWRLTIGSMILLPLVIFPVGKIGRRIRQAVQSSQSKLAELSQILQETVSGNRVVKAFGM